MRNKSDKSLCLIGDFNCVRNEDERKACQYRSLDSKGFNEFIVFNELIDVKSCNSIFTWNGRLGKQSRLDRALVNWIWLEHGDWEIEVLDRKNSDHRAIFLKSIRRNWGPKPFKFFDCWLQDENLSKIIRSKWKDSVGLDSHLKLREVKKEIISWNRSLNGDINSKIRRLENLQFVHDERGASDELKHRTNEELMQAYNDRASMLYQKSRFKWHMEGDRNTRFFHNWIKRRWNKVQIMKIH